MVGAISGSSNFSYWAQPAAYTSGREGNTGRVSDPIQDGSQLLKDPQSDSSELSKIPGQSDKGECQTCNSRKYQDGSNDPGVSFKTPTKLDPQQASSSVRGHEMQHVFRERGKAQRENREVVSQSVTYHTAICPECGRSYVSGGTTRTTTRAKEDADKFRVGMEGQGNGRYFDDVA